MTGPGHKGFKTIARLPRVKVVDNLFKVGDTYYYRKGETEKKLGKFDSDKDAITAKELFEAKRDTLGIRAYKFKAKHVWPDYLEQRRKQRDGEIAGRKRDSPLTYREIDNTWKIHLRKFFANRKLADIDDPLWNSYCRKSKVGDLTNHRKVLKTFLKWCMVNGYLRALPILEVPKVVRRKRRILSQDQIIALLHNSSGRLLLFVSLYLLMGMRWTEIRLLRKESINLWKRTLRVEDGTTRTRKGRIIKINRFVTKLIVVEYRRHKAAAIETPWLFPKRSRPAQPMIDTAMRRPWARLLVRAGLEGFTPHDMRATFEYWQAMNPKFTDTQREKNVGASMQMQKDRYLVDTDAKFVAGLEESVKFEALDRLKQTKLKKASDRDNTEKGRENEK